MITKLPIPGHVEREHQPHRRLRKVAIAFSAVPSPERWVASGGQPADAGDVSESGRLLGV